MSITRRSGALAFAAAALCAAMAGGTAHAGTPADWVDPGTEGSLVDTQNLIGATVSDLSATGAATDGRCSSTATTPAERFDPNSDTRRVIFSRVTLTCVGGDKDEYWRMQRHRWNGWKTLTSIQLTDATNFTADLVTNCRAGTWSYRVEANEYKTKSYRTTCSRPDDIFFIDNAAQ